MNLFIALLGVTMVAVGIFWRLRKIEVQAKAGATLGMARHRRGAQPRRPSASKASRQARKAAEAEGAEAEAPHETAPSAIGQAFRRGNRVLLRIPLEVSGTDLVGNPFTERTHTLNINRKGASFVLRNSLCPEAQMTVKNLQTGQSCRFRACRAKQDLPGGLSEWGVECVDPAPIFWGISFPEATVDPSAEEENIGSLLECTVCSYREMTQLTLSQYRTIVEETSLARYCSWCEEVTGWEFAVAVSLPSDAEKCRKERRIARLPISIRHEDGREEFTIAENVSKSGVCFAANMELEVGDRVFLTLESDEGSGEVETRAQIMWRRRLSEKGGNLYGLTFDHGESRPT